VSPEGVAIPHGRLGTQGAYLELEEGEEKSPSYPVGLERGRGIGGDTESIHKAVSIPRGGLRTQKTTLYGKFQKQSRHPTRWARNAGVKYITYCKPNLKSPSHAVGLELYQEGKASFYLVEVSPSHAVGSERGQGDSISVGREAGGEASVTIPHCGLGTEGFTSAVGHHSTAQSPSHTVGLKHLPKTLKTKTLTLSKFRQPTERAH